MTTVGTQGDDMVPDKLNSANSSAKTIKFELKIIKIPKISLIS